MCWRVCRCVLYVDVCVGVCVDVGVCGMLTCVCGMLTCVSVCVIC